MQDQINYNIEDTGKLMTQSKRSGRGKKTGLIIFVVAAVLIVALVGAYFGISNKKYEDQVAIANKAFVEGDYEQAEAAFLKAVDMNKRKAKAREGLAYTYAVEGKFTEAKVIYDELYVDFKDENYNIASQYTEEEEIPQIYEIVPAKKTWRLLPENQVGYYTALKWYLFALEADYFCWADTAFDCNDPGDFPLHNLIMSGIGNYDISIEDYAAYATSNDDTYLEGSILSWEDGEDPRGWNVETEMEGSYETADAETADKLIKDIFNVSGDAIKNSLKNCEEEHTVYLEDGTYYCVSGWNQGTIDSAIQVKAVWTDGIKYCVQYLGGWDYEENWEQFTVDKAEPYTERYALIEPKLIDGKHYWSLYSVGTEMPAEVVEGLNAAAQTGGNDNNSNDSAAAYQPVIDEYKTMLANVEAGAVYDSYEDGSEFTYVFDELIPDNLNDYRQPTYAIQDINGDGIDEMIVGAEFDGTDYFGSILTLDESGAPVVILNCDSFMYRGEMNIFKDGRVMNGGSSGATSSRHEVYEIVNTDLKLVDSYVMEDGVCSHNGEGMSEDDYFEAVKKVRSQKQVKVKWNSF